MLVLAALLAAAVPPLLPPDPPPRIRPATELRCIYEAAPPQMREAVATQMWRLDGDKAPISDLLAQAADTCRFRYHWDMQELVMALIYAQSEALLDYAHRQFSALHVDASRLDRIYRAVPVEERTRRESRVAPQSMVADLILNRNLYAGDPGIAEHIGAYVAAMVSVERTQRMWARLMPFAWF